MPYEVLTESATVLKSHGTFEGVHDHESIIYVGGDVIADEDVSPVVHESYDSGDKHTLSVIKRVSGEAVAKTEADDEPAQAAKGAKKK